MNKEEKLNNLYQEKTILKEQLEEKQNSIKYISRLLRMAFYIIFLAINIYIFKITIISSIILGGIFANILTIPLKYNLNKIAKNKYKKEEDKLNILIHLLENKNIKKDINNNIKEKYKYKYNPKYKNSIATPITINKEKIKTRNLIIDTKNKKLIK